MSIRANYTEIPGIAGSMSSEGGDMSKIIADTFKVVDDLKQTWCGIRYNTVTAEFNGGNTRYKYIRGV